jgi:hypothetical protein
MSLYDDVILPDVGINLNPSPNESNTSKASNPGTNSASSVTSAKPESDIGTILCKFDKHKINRKLILKNVTV